MKTLAAALLCALLAGCATPLPSPTVVPSASPSPSTSSSRPNLGIWNQTHLVVTLVVSGQSVGDFPPAGPAPTGPAPTIDLAALPALPWHVEARSPSGRALTSLEVRPSDVQGDANHFSYAFDRVDLSCGLLTIWASYWQPVEGPARPASPGDCAP